MTSERFVSTRAIREAVKGREPAVLSALGIDWEDGAGHITCPYPDHADRNPSWRWNGKRRSAHCTCDPGSHSILDVVMRCAGLDFEAAKLRVAEILGRTDLIRRKHGERMDAASLLRPPPEQSDASLPGTYLGSRLGVAPEEVLMPITPVSGWRALAYFDAPAGRRERPKLVGHFPCAVFGTCASDDRTHAHRIYLAEGGAGKAELGTTPGGKPRDPKKSAPLRKGQRAAGCVVVWGPPAADHLLLFEGVETASAGALAHRAELEAGELAVAAALSTSGIISFQPWAEARRITVCADRDEGGEPTDRGNRAGEKAARAFAAKHRAHLEVRIALPGGAGEKLDWLDVLRSGGLQAVRAGIAAAQPLQEVPDDAGGLPEAHARAGASEDDLEGALTEIVAQAGVEPSTAFEPEALVTLVAVRQDDPPAYQRTISQLKQAGVRLRDLERELRRTSFRVIEGGPATRADASSIEAGPYFVIRHGGIAWRKETRDGSVAIPLCNFTAQIVAEEVVDDGAERRTVLAIEGALPDGRALPYVRVPAERYPAMNWVTDVWGTAPVIFAGQGKKDHLRAAIQMLSGEVPRRTIYGHLGWRRLGDCWSFLHAGGAIGPGGALEGIEVETGTDGFLDYRLPPPPSTTELADAVRASLDLLELGPATITAPVLGAVYRAPLGEIVPIDFGLHLTGPTGAFKTELAALAQAHFGADFNGRRLPGSWADTANMLEKKAFLSKDLVLVVDDFAPVGTAADIQRLHREADRLFRAAGNRSGRARMRADGGSRPTYYPRGLIISTGEDIPSGQSLRARLLVVELTPDEITADVLSAAQADAAAGRFAAAMAGYLRWLAPQMDLLKATLPQRQRALRDGLVESSQHRRTPEIAASVILGWEMFLRFAEETGALGRDDATRTLARVRAALTDSAERQGAHQASEEPATRFLVLLRAAISSGRAHVADADTGAQPEEAACWGWQRNSVGSGDCDREAWRANGERLGWIRDEELLLDPEAAFAAAHKLARDQSTSIPIKQRTLWKRLADEGLLASRDLARGTSTVRRTIQGLRRDLLHIRTSTLAAQTDQRGGGTDQRTETDQEKGSQRRGFPGPGQFGQFGQKIEPRGSSRRDLRDAVGWEVEI